MIQKDKITTLNFIENFSEEEILILEGFLKPEKSSIISKVYDFLKITELNDKIIIRISQSKK